MSLLFPYDSKLVATDVQACGDINACVQDAGSTVDFGTEVVLQNCSDAHQTTGLHVACSACGRSVPLGHRRDLLPPISMHPKGTGCKSSKREPSYKAPLPAHAHRLRIAACSVAALLPLAAPCRA
jgi:hypothetical protein